MRKGSTSKNLVKNMSQKCEELVRGIIMYIYRKEIFFLKSKNI